MKLYARKFRAQNFSVEIKRAQFEHARKMADEIESQNNQILTPTTPNFENTVESFLCRD